MRRTLPPLSYTRLIQNRIAPLSAVQLLTRELVEAAVDDALEERWSRDEQHGGWYYLGVDAGVSEDRAAAVLVHKDYERGKIVVDNVAIWYPPVRLAHVEEHVMDMSSGRFGSVRLILDVWQMKSFAQRAEEAGIDVIEFTFSPANIARMTNNLLRLFKEKEIALYRCQPLLDELVTVRLEERRHGGVRIEHDRNRHDDMTVALAMACVFAVDESIPWVPEDDDYEPDEELARLFDELYEMGDL